LIRTLLQVRSYAAADDLPVEVRQQRVRITFCAACDIDKPPLITANTA
jgi:hypothetical protein